MWRFHNPVSIIFNRDYSSVINELIENKKRRLLFFVYNKFKRNGKFIELTGSFKNSDVIKKIEIEPSFESCNEAFQFAKKFKPEAIIAIGGGSVIDTAKIVKASLMENVNKIDELFHNTGKKKDKNKNKNILFIAIPTTHGTGSELTKWATLWDKKNRKKYSFEEDYLYPNFAVYDIQLIKNLPSTISISSSLDALSHSFEALWNKNSNPISDNFAFLAIELIYKNLLEFINHNDLLKREKLFIASMYAGLAFSNTKTAAAHSISYPLTLYYKIPHGIACSMPLFPLLKINFVKIRSKLELLFSRLQIESFEELDEKFFKKIATKIPFSLKEYNITLNDIDKLSDLSFTKGRMDNNIVPLNKKDVFNILLEIL